MKRNLTGVMLAVAAIVVGAAGASNPGSNGLIVYAQQVKGKHQLFTVHSDGSGSRQITHLRGEATHPDWSPDGRKLVFGLETEKSAAIAVVSADGTGLHTLIPTGFQGQASYSPDGRWIVYERDIAEGNNGVWLMRADGTGKRRVTRSPGCCDTDPNFSPDGKLITFVRVKEEEKLQALFAVRPDGSALRRLTPFEWEIAIKHDWSPVGKLIVVTTNADFVRPSESANLVTIRPDGSGMKRLTQFKGGKKNAFAGSFSPDGKQIVFRLEEGDTYGLAVINRDGANLRMLTPLGEDKPRFIDWGTHR